MNPRIIEGTFAMLAKPASSGPVDFPVYIQPKLDGVRCLFTKDGAFTRRGNKFMNVAHLEAQLFEFFKEFPDVVLDGELYNHSLKHDFDKIISLVRKTVNISFEDRTEASSLVQFHIYDIVANGDLPYVGRLDTLETLNYAWFESMNNVILTETFKLNSQSELDMMHNIFKDDGYEGSILRTTMGYYEHKRSKSLMKVKDFQDAEAIIFDVIEGKGKLKGKVGKFMMRFPNGLEFGCPMSAHDFQAREDAWANRESYIGKEATAEFFELTKRGVPRFPVFKGVRDYE